MRGQLEHRQMLQSFEIDRDQTPDQERDKRRRHPCRAVSFIAHARL
jgi:hypothetical protein